MNKRRNMTAAGSLIRKTAIVARPIGVRPTSNPDQINQFLLHASGTPFVVPALAGSGINHEP
jgi:hypothetical protein